MSAAAVAAAMLAFGAGCAAYVALDIALSERAASRRESMPPCGECGRKLKSSYASKFGKYSNYCPNCGAKVVDER